MSLEEVRAAIRAERPGSLVGSDECGLGSWAGELVTCAVAAPCDWDPGDPLVRDSKTLSPAQREEVYKRYFNQEAEEEHKLVISPAVIEVGELNCHPIHDCLKRAHGMAITGTFWRLPCLPLVVVDGIVEPDFSTLSYKPQVYCLPKADSLVPAVALASIIAKVTRDRMMVEWAKKYPEYGFDKSMGYGTKYHAEALKKYGPCPIHRVSYGPIRQAIEALAARQNPSVLDLMEEIDNATQK